MNRLLKSERIKQLKENGYKRVPGHPNIYLNECGKAFDVLTGKELNPKADYKIYVENKYLNVAKLILLTFKGEPIRHNQRINYRDGDRGNLRLGNIEYARKYESAQASKINAPRLYMAIRCCFHVFEKYKIKNVAYTRSYLSRMLKERDFFAQNRKREDIEIFRSYMQGITNNYTSVAKLHNISIWDCKCIISGFINELADSILSDMAAGILQLKEYQPRTRKQSTKAKVKAFKKYIADFKTN